MSADVPLFALATLHARRGEPGLNVRLYPMPASADWPGEPGEAVHGLSESAGFIRTVELTAENDDGQG